MKEKIKRENPDGDLDEEIRKIVVKISEALQTTFLNSFFIEEIDEPDCSENFQEKIQIIRSLIFHTEKTFLNNQCVTWSHLMSYYMNEIINIENDELARKAAIDLELKNEREQINKLNIDKVYIRLFLFSQEGILGEKIIENIVGMRFKIIIT